MTFWRLCAAWSWPVVAGLALCAHASVGRAGLALEKPEREGRLAQVDAIRTADHARFVIRLAELHHDADALDSDDKWHLRYLDGWEANYEGRYPAAETILRDVMDHSPVPALATRATALMMDTLSEQGRYAEAYAIATRAADALDDVTDPLARMALLANLSQMLTFAGQPDLGLKYADMMVEATPAGQSPCQALVQKVTALEGARKLTPNSPELTKTFDICTADKQPIFANTIALILVDRLLQEKKTAEALSVVRRVSPSITASRYVSHIIDLAAQRAQIYEQMGNASEARQAALEAVSMGHAGDINEGLRSAYRVLYNLDKALGHTANALDYYERYVIQDQGYLRDANVRNAAYEAAREHFHAEKLETEGLSKENRILRLQQALDSKAVETSRLYIVVLLLILLSIVFWMVRIKRSQLRFKWLSSCDGLTGIFHHQHFMGEAERTLRAMERRSGDACLVFLDLDHFKHVNDTYGHAVGDVVLKHAVAICKGQLRKDDLLGRLGGEEFAMLLMDTPHLQGTVVAERIRLALATSQVNVGDVIVNISASIGMAYTQEGDYDLQRLCRAADAALYRAKRLGRNRIAVDGDEVAPAAAMARLS